jgi:hypothetical protein
LWLPHCKEPEYIVTFTPLYVSKKTKAENSKGKRRTKGIRGRIRRIKIKEDKKKHKNHKEFKLI